MACCAAPAAFATGGSGHLRRPGSRTRRPRVLSSSCNAAGQPVTSGTFAGSSAAGGEVDAFKYAEASNNAGVAGAKAALSWGFPNHSVTPPSSLFSTGSGTATAYPAAARVTRRAAEHGNQPGRLQPGRQRRGHHGCGRANDATAGYNQVLQVRLYTLGGAGGSNAGGLYWTSDISYTYNAATQTGTWTEIASDFGSNVTYTALTATPASAPAGTSIALTATETDRVGAPRLPGGSVTPSTTAPRPSPRTSR